MLFLWFYFVIFILVALKCLSNIKALSFSITKSYAVDMQVFKKIRYFKDGLSIASIDINWDRYKADHNPKLYILCVLFNYCIFEIDIYNINHADDND